MTTIAGMGRVSGAIPSATRRAGPGGFAVPARTEAGPAAATSSVAELSGLLLMQEAGGAEVRDREARRRGNAMLKGLAAVQRALLTGRDDLDALHQLRDLAEDEADAADPGLLAALRATRLRAQVELARRGL